MDRKIIFSTTPNEEGEFLWCVHFASSYHDDGTVPVDGHFFVLAKSEEEAKDKLKGEIKKIEKRCDKGADKKIVASIASLESLIIARDSSNDGRLGWHSTKGLSPVSLDNEGDRKRYRLGVCLIPID